MKKMYLLVATIMCVALSSFSQKNEKAIGLNLGYGSEIESLGIGAKFNYGLTNQVRLSPSFNYFIKKDGLSAWEINADAHYLFNIGSKVNLYPLAGLTLTGWKFDWGIDGLEDYGIKDSSSSETKFGVNLGGGIDYKLSDNIAIGGEVKYSIISDFDQLVLMLNLMYSF